MVRNSPCSVCFLTSKPLRPGRIELFVVCLVSIGCSLSFFFYMTNSKNKFFKTDFCFDHFPVFVLFCFIDFYSKGGFLIA